MATVMTVTGPVPAEKLGYTLMHEHLFLDLSADYWDNNRFLNDPELTQQELERYKRAGGVSLVDQTNRGLGRDPLGLTVDACLAAIADAGLSRADIDGVATYPGAMQAAPGFSGAGVTELQDALRLDLNWWTGGPETSGQLGSTASVTASPICWAGRPWKAVASSSISES